MSPAPAPSSPLTSSPIPPPEPPQPCHLWWRVFILLCVFICEHQPGLLLGVYRAPGIPSLLPPWFWAFSRPLLVLCELASSLNSVPAGPLVGSSSLGDAPGGMAVVFGGRVLAVSVPTSQRSRGWRDPPMDARMVQMVSQGFVNLHSHQLLMGAPQALERL